MDAGASLTILVPLDGSEIAERALPMALELARPDDRVVLLRVVAPPDAFYDQILRRYLPVTDQDHERKEAAAHRALVEVAARHVGARIDLCVRTGDPAEQILFVAEDLDAGLIVMASHGYGAFDRWRFGSVSDRVVRSAAIPVMVARRTAAPVPLSRILLAYDDSELSAVAIPTAAQLARRLGLPVRVVRALDLGRAEAKSTYDAPIPDNVKQEIEIEICAKAAESVRRVANRLHDEGLDAESEVLLGAAGPTLLAEAKPGDLVVLASHGRGGVRRWLLGSVAEKLIRLAEAPVVVVPAAWGLAGSS